MSVSEWEYRVETDTVLLFLLNDGRIARMMYEENPLNKNSTSQ